MTPREFLLKTNKSELTFKDIEIFGFSPRESHVVDEGMRAKHEFAILIKCEMIRHGYLPHANYYAGKYIHCLNLLESIEEHEKLYRKIF